MTYNHFKRNNNIAKSHFDSLGRLSNVNLKDNTCTLTFEDRVTNNIPIQTIIEDIMYNAMGAVSNPSALRKWEGFS